MWDDQFYAGSVDHDIDFDASGDLMTPISFQAYPGQKVRVVFTYDQCFLGGGSGVTDDLLADMDLVVRESSLEPDEPGFRVHTNNSHVDNTEIVEFTVSVRSRISVNVSVQHWDACKDGSRKTYMAIAWDRLSAP